MIPFSYNMVDMGGIDLAEANHTVVPGIYEKIVEAINLCGDLILYNWKFADINIAPSAYTVLQQSDSILINGLIQVTELDEVIVDLGGSVETYAFVVVDYPVGATCTASNGSVLITAPDTSGHAVFAIPSAGTWTIAYVGSSGQASVSVDILSYGVSQKVSFTVPLEYKEVAYLEIGPSAGPYMNIQYSLNSACEFEVKSQYTGTPNNNSWLFGAYVSGKQTNLGYTQSRVYIQTGGSNVSFALDTLQHVYASKQDAFYYDGTAQTGAIPNWANTVTTPTKMFYIGDGAYSNNCRMYYLKIWKNGVLDRHFMPCYRKADNKPGMYDLINDVFYTNNGSGEFILGPEV